MVVDMTNHKRHARTHTDEEVSKKEKAKASCWCKPEGFGAVLPATEAHFPQ